MTYYNRPFHVTPKVPFEVQGVTFSPGEAILVDITAAGATLSHLQGPETPTVTVTASLYTEELEPKLKGWWSGC